MTMLHQLTIIAALCFMIAFVSSQPARAQSKKEKTAQAENLINEGLNLKHRTMTAAGL